MRPSKSGTCIMMFIIRSFSTKVLRRDSELHPSSVSCRVQYAFCQNPAGKQQQEDKAKPFPRARPSSATPLRAYARVCVGAYGCARIGSYDSLRVGGSGAGYRPGRYP